MSEILTEAVPKETLDKAFDFAIKYHLDPKKGRFNRTTGQTRGLGGVIDSFLRGKVVEQCIVNILHKFNGRKICGLDFEVHDVSDDDPDIIGVKEGSTVRPPKLFVEIKNVADTDRWEGLTEEQFETIRKNNIVGDDLDKIFIVYANIRNRNSSHTKKDDMLGVFLRSELGSNQYEGFSDINDLYVEVSLVLSGRELLEKGTKFEKGYLFYETEIFKEVEEKIVKRKNISKTDYKKNTLPRFQYEKKYPYPEKFGDIKYEGKIVLFKKENEKSNRVYIYCITDVKVRNNVLGEFKLDKGCYYEYMPKTVSRDPVLKRNNIWIAKRNASSIVAKTPKERLKEIAEKI